MEHSKRLFVWSQFDIKLKRSIAPISLTEVHLAAKKVLSVHNNTYIYRVITFKSTISKIDNFKATGQNSLIF